MKLKEICNQAGTINQTPTYTLWRTSKIPRITVFKVRGDMIMTYNIL